MPASFPDRDQGRFRLPIRDRCEEPCCRRQFMDDDSDWSTLADARPFRRAGPDVNVVGRHQRADGCQPMLECQAFDIAHLRCPIDEQRPEHCRIYDRRDDDPEEWQARPHCELERHRRRRGTKGA